MRNAIHEYAFDGRSRASYMVRCKTKTGMICSTTWLKTVRKMKTPNIWFCKPRCVFSAFRKERPMKRACGSVSFTVPYDV